MAAKTRNDRHDFKTEGKQAARSEFSLAIINNGSVVSVLGPLPYHGASLAPSVQPMHEFEFMRMGEASTRVSDADIEAMFREKVEFRLRPLALPDLANPLSNTEINDYLFWTMIFFRIYAEGIGVSKLLDAIQVIADSIYKLDRQAISQTDLKNRKPILDAITLIESSDASEAARVAVIASLKKMMLPAGLRGPDLSAWKPSEQYANRLSRPDLGRKENIVEFLQRVWSPILANAGEVPVAKLREEDSAGLYAWYKWKEKHGAPASLAVVSRTDIAAVRNELEAPLPRTHKSTATVKAENRKIRKGQLLQLE